MKISLYTLVTVFLLSCTSSLLAAGNIVNVYPLKKAPSFDGLDDWQDIPFEKIVLRSIKKGMTHERSEIFIKAGVHEDTVYFYLQWPDKTEDKVHKPWIWDKDKKKYVRGPQREDRLALQFRISGDYSTNWASGNEFVADMWHWKASRSNPLGIAHDKMTRLSHQKILRSATIKDEKGRTLFINRNQDQGDSLYRTKRYRKYVEDEMPRYILQQNIKGSTTDVKARGVWRDGRWHLKLKRKLKTGYDDDVVFVPGKTVVGGVAVFNHSENDGHLISETIRFRF